MVTLTLSAPGPWANRDELVAAWKEVDPQIAFEGDVLVLPSEARFNVRVEGPDPELAAVFADSDDATSPSLSPEELDALPAHDGVAVLVSEPFSPEDAGRIAFSALMLPGMIAGAGAIAVRCDSVGLAHGLDWWIELAERAGDAYGRLLDAPEADPTEDRYELFDALFRAFVSGPGEADGVFFTVGLHLLGLPEVEVAAVDIDDARNPGLHAWTLFHIVGTYALAEAPLDDGDVLRLAEDAPGWRLVAGPCRFGEGDPRHNPHGALRLVPGA